MPVSNRTKQATYWPHWNGTLCQLERGLNLKSTRGVHKVDDSWQLRHDLQAINTLIITCIIIRCSCKLTQIAVIRHRLTCTPTLRLEFQILLRRGKVYLSHGSVNQCQGCPARTKHWFVDRQATASHSTSQLRIEVWSPWRLAKVECVAHPEWVIRRPFFLSICLC